MAASSPPDRADDNRVIIHNVSWGRYVLLRELLEDSQGKFEIHRLGEDGYRAVERSGFLPDLDLALLARFAAYADQTEAVLAFRAALNG